MWENLRLTRNIVWSYGVGTTAADRICCCYSVTKLCLTLCDPMACSMPGSSVLHYLLRSLLKFLCIETVVFSTISSSPAHFSFDLRSFQASESFPVNWLRSPKYWSFSFSISPSNEYSGLISFRMDWFDLLAVQGTLKSFLQHHSLKVPIFWYSAFFMVHSHICTWLLEKP